MIPSMRRHLALTTAVATVIVFSAQAHAADSIRLLPSAAGAPGDTATGSALPQPVAKPAAWRKAAETPEPGPAASLSQDNAEPPAPMLKPTSLLPDDQKNQDVEGHPLGAKTSDDETPPAMEEHKAAQQLAEADQDTELAASKVREQIEAALKAAEQDRARLLSEKAEKADGVQNPAAPQKPAYDPPTQEELGGVFQDLFQTEEDMQPASSPERDDRAYIPEGLALKNFTSQPFLDGEQSLSSVVAEEMGADMIIPGDFIQMAKFYVAWGMVKEAKSFLEHIAPTDKTGQERVDAMALYDALNALDGTRPDNGYDVIGKDEFKAWPDWAAWTSYERATRKAWQDAGPLLDEALVRIRDYPDGLATEMLTPLAEAAIETGKLDLAGRMIKEAERGVFDMEGETALTYLTAKRHLAAGAKVRAFDALVAATAGEGRYAQRARIDLVDMGLNSKRMEFEDALTLLEQARFEWRGDNLEAETLKRIAVLKLKTGDRVGSVEDLAIMTLRFPDTADSMKAQQNIESMLKAIYRDGEAGRIKLGDFIATHERFRNLIGWMETFHPYALRYARMMEKRSMVLAAASEYGFLSETTTDPRVKSGHLVQRARLLEEGGRHEAARRALSAAEDHGVPADMIPTHRTTSAKVARAIGNLEVALRDASVIPVGAKEAEGLRIIGDVHWTKEEWEAAKEIYLRIHERHPEHASPLEIIRLLVSAYKSGDIDLFSRTYRSNTEIVGGSEWQRITEGMIDPRVLPKELRKDFVDRSISSTEDTERLVNNVSQ